MFGTVVRHLPRISRRNAIAVTAALGVLVALPDSPASARPDPGSWSASVLACGPFTDPRTVPVRAIGNHLARCDYLVR
jgi:hypothetical protein